MHRPALLAHVRFPRLQRLVIALAVGGVLSGLLVPTPASAVGSGAPVLSGIPAVGQTMSVTNGTWTGTIVSYLYQWERCNAAGTSCTDIDGATTNTRTLIGADAGYRIRVRVSAYNGTGYATANSNLSNVINGQQAYFKAHVPVTGHSFGSSIAVSGNTLVAAGANTSKADIFVRGNDGAWSYQATLTASNAEFNDGFGGAVAISGNTVVVGARLEDSDGSSQADNSVSSSGAAYVFVRSGTSWSQEAYLKAATPAVSAYFGVAVAVDGDTILVGASGDGVGKATVFTRASGNWTRRAELTPSNGASGDSFGGSVAIDGSTIAIGSSLEDGVAASSGAAYVFTGSGASWTEQAYLKAATPVANATYGCSVSVSGATVLVGARNNLADVYAFDGSAWTRQATLQGSNTDSGDYFGYASRISGDRIVVGAFSEDSAATGIDGDASDDSAIDSGAAYVFSRSGSAWSQVSYLKASNTEAGDRFGVAVGISGNSIVVGADLEDSAATDVGGNQSDNSLSGSGAVYGYSITEPPIATQAPVVSGDTIRDGWVNATTGTWTPEPTHYAYQWQRCSVLGSSCSDIAGATNASYRLVGKDVGRTVRVKVIADGRGTANSAVTALIVGLQDYFKPEAGETMANMGYGPVAISGETMVVGATEMSGTQEGRAYIYVRAADGAWSRQATLRAPVPEAGAFFGFAVDVDGDRVVVGAPYQSGGGAVYVFERSGMAWSAGYSLTASHRATGQNFGMAVAVNGSTVAVGAPNESSASTGIDGDDTDTSAPDAGAAFVFTKSGSTWSQQAYIKASNAGTSDYFGNAVDLESDTLVVGAPGEASNSRTINAGLTNNSASWTGAGYVFVRSGATWTQQTYLKAANADEGDYFGLSVAISGDRVIIGAPNEDSPSRWYPNDNSTVSAGAAYMFKRTSTTWTQEQFLKANPTAAYDRFGETVAIDGVRALIGAPGDDASTFGMNVPKIGFLANSGAVYLFRFRGDYWNKEVYIKATNSEESDGFGGYLALSGTSIVGASPYEDSAATGIGGDQTNNSLNESGAVFVYTISGFPYATSDPSITGDPYVGETLTAHPGTWLDAESNSYTWYRCTETFSACNEITGATESEYTIIGADIGFRIQLYVFGYNALGMTNANPAYTAVVIDIPVNTALPTISGTLKPGQVLTATTGTWDGSPTSYDYQWQECDAAGGSCADITGETSSTFTVRVLDVGGTVRVKVTATNAVGSDDAFSAASGLITAVTPTVLIPDNTVLPSISGLPYVGRTLTGSTGSWSHTPTSYGLQWSRCDAAGMNCVDIPLATGMTYVVSGADAGRTFRFIVTASNAAGSAVAVSNPTSSGLDTPTNTIQPTIEGVAAVGKTLTAVNGTWMGANTFAYQWERCDANGGNCVAIKDATLVTYLVVAADAATRIRLVVSGGNAAGFTDAPSLPTAVVVAAPLASGSPQISGVSAVGQTLTISTGTWTNAPTGYAYQWQRCDQSGTCAAVVGATAASYQPAVADIGSTFKVEVSATNIAGTAKVLSSTSATVLGKPTVVTAPRISGVAAVKRKLTAQAGAWTSAPTSFSYQWLRCNAAGKGCLKIARATGPIYKPVAADAGKTLRVSVFAKNIVGTTGTKTATRKVAIKR